MPALLAGMSAIPEPLSCDRKHALFLIGRQANHDLAGMAVLDRVVYRFLGNMIEMRRHVSS